MKKLLIALIVVMALSDRARAEENIVKLIAPYFDTYHRLVKDLNKESGWTPKKEGFCRAAEQAFPAIYGNIDAQVTKLSGALAVNRKYTYRSICGNFIKLAEMNEDDFTTFYLIMGTTVKKSLRDLKITDEPGRLFPSGVYSLKFYNVGIDADINVFGLLIKLILEPDNEEGLFWFDFKRSMIIDFLNGEDLKKYTQSRMGQGFIVFFGMNYMMGKDK